MPVNPKYLEKVRKEQVEATIESLAEVREALERLEKQVNVFGKKIDALGRMMTNKVESRKSDKVG